MIARFPTSPKPRPEIPKRRRSTHNDKVAWPPRAWRDAVVEPPGRGTPKRWSYRGSGG